MESYGYKEENILHGIGNHKILECELPPSHSHSSLMLEAIHAAGEESR